jgi:uncharacterized Rmd1/YagE family protein
MKTIFFYLSLIGALFLFINIASMLISNSNSLKSAELEYVVVKLLVLFILLAIAYATRKPKDSLNS